MKSVKQDEAESGETEDVGAEESSAKVEEDDKHCVKLERLKRKTK